MTARQRLQELGLHLPAALPAKGAYLPARVHGDIVFVSGHTGRTATEAALTGTVGDDLDVEAARASARQAALNLLGAVHRAAGLDRVEGVLQLRGYVRAAPSFGQHPAVIDAASELLTQVFGAGHARAAVGVVSLPGGAAVELEAIFALKTR